jgi:dTDP-D-glucose 4,6-dehydratase
MGELLELCASSNAKKYEMFLSRANTIARQMNRDHVLEFVNFVVDRKLNDLRYSIAEESDETRLWELKREYSYWKKFPIEFDALINSILVKENKDA